MFTCVNAQKKTLEIQFICIDNKEIFCIFKTCCIIFVSFFTKCSVFHNFTLNLYV